MQFYKIAAFFTLAFFANSFAQCPNIEAGTIAYNQNDFERAIDEWRTCEDSGMQNADLYYNLGNANFRNSKLGFAIYYYKLALRLDPNNSDILHNLKFAKSLTKDKVDEDDEENPLLSVLYKAHHALSLNAQLYLILALFWLIAIVALSRKIKRGEYFKNATIGVQFALTAMLSLIIMSAGYKIFVAETEIEGVVTATDADVTSAPSENSQTLNTLSEGTLFKVLSTQNSYAEISLGEKIRGFVKLSNVGIIK